MSLSCKHYFCHITHFADIVQILYQILLWRLWNCNPKAGLQWVFRTSKSKIRWYRLKELFSILLHLILLECISYSKCLTLFAALILSLWNLLRKCSLILLCLIGLQKPTTDSLSKIVEDLLSLTWPNSKSSHIISDLCFYWTHFFHSMTRFMGEELQDFVNLS
jgi:hypothetical protein